MSDSRKDPGRDLDALVREARSSRELEPDVDEAAFKALEDRIVARMANESAARARSPLARSPLAEDVHASPSRARVFQIGAVVLAAAAAIALVLNKDPGGSPLGGAATITPDLSAGSLRAAEGPGEVRVGGLLVSAGHVLRAGDVVEVDGARAVLERPRKVTWLLEHGTAEGAAAAPLARAHVKSAGESLVIGLDDGAIEAQVTPVPSGEAFAVDVAAGNRLVRVAVHGTHLRVARVGSRVTVDLSEGVVSIGVPPRTGSTYGTLVTAPSHVEFDAANLDATLKIDHAPSAVRAAVPLVSHEPVVGLAARSDVPAAAPLGVAPFGATGAVGVPGSPGSYAAFPAGGPGSPAAPATVPRPTSVPRSVADPSRVDPAAPAKPAVAPRDAIAAAVRDCAAARRRPENVRVTVTTSLKLKISADGAVDVAQFDPPLLPEIQTCAAATIYKAKLDDAASGSVTIPINFSY